jgi:hypothetical protein
MKPTIHNNQHLNLVQCYSYLFFSLKQVIMQLIAVSVLVSSLLAVSLAVCTFAHIW